MQLKLRNRLSICNSIIFTIIETNSKSGLTQLNHTVRLVLTNNETPND
jgi:hypothetical protein